MFGQRLVGVNASENAQNNRGQMEGMQGERKMKISWGADESKKFSTRRQGMQKWDAETIQKTW